MKIGVAPEEFIWAGGIEDTFVPQTRPGHRALDEYQLMGHYEHWREDLHACKHLGVGALRWGIPWYRVEPMPGEFDWRWTDEVLPYMVEELGITPILDLMHYGCPFWLRREFAADEYPDRVAAYARAVAERYGHLVTLYTPLNEPAVNALMCGRRGLWPPYLRGDGGYIRVMLQLARGIQKTVRAIKEVQPDATMVHVEATGLTRAIRAELHALAVEDQRRGYLCFDLITGRIGPDHPLWTWLLRHHVSPDDLARLAENAIGIDVMGMNFYPQWSTQQLYHDSRGRLRSRATEHTGDGFAALIRDYYEHYRAPVMITETSAFKHDKVRSRWLADSVRAVRELRGAGVPVVGYTWFPLLTMIDWKYRLGKQPLERYRIELGMYTLNDDPSGPRWKETPLVDEFRALIADTPAAIGPFIPSPRREPIEC